VLVTAPQNIAEFWNVCTRPATARGGFGLSLEETQRQLRLIERLLRILPESPASYSIWKQLVVRHAVLGVQVHDARLVALMQAHNVTHIQPRGLPSLPQHHRHLSDGPPRCSSPGPGSLEPIRIRGQDS
jgi:hypothetical protein